MIGRLQLSKAIIIVLPLERNSLSEYDKNVVSGALAATTSNCSNGHYHPPTCLTPYTLHVFSRPHSGPRRPYRWA